MEINVDASRVQLDGSQQRHKQTNSSGLLMGVDVYHFEKICVPGAATDR